VEEGKKDKKRKAQDSTEEQSAKKTRLCPITRTEFTTNAQSLNLILEGQKYSLSPKVFKTKSFGWTFSGTLGVKVGDQTIDSQVVINVAVPASKEAQD